MEKIKKEWWLHIRHYKLAEQSDCIEKRIEFIKACKPIEEQELHLKLLKKVKNQQAMQEYDQAHKRAWKARDQARQEYELAREQAWQAYDNQTYEQEYEQEYEQALQTYNQALQTYTLAIEALHKLECPDCPWDGHTIFPPGS